MGRLITQLCTAIDAWADSNDGNAVNVIMPMVLATGMQQHVQATGVIDPQTVPVEERSGLTWGQVNGYYTTAQVGNYLSALVNAGFTESFLVPALVHHVEQYLESLSENYAVRIAKNREFLEEFRTIHADEEKRAEFEAKMNATSTSGPKADISAFIDQSLIFFEEQSTPSISEMRRYRKMLTDWQALTSSVMETDNLRQADEEALDDR